MTHFPPFLVVHDGYRPNKWDVTSSLFSRPFSSLLPLAPLPYITGSTPHLYTPTARDNYEWLELHWLENLGKFTHKLVHARQLMVVISAKLVSKSDIRYVGILHDIDAQNSTIALEQGNACRTSIVSSIPNLLLFFQWYLSAQKGAGAVIQPRRYRLLTMYSSAWFSVVRT